jgi:hypothetical protein
VYTALATVALHDNTYRRTVLDSESIIPSLTASLSSSHLGVRYSSTQLTRVVSRSIDVLRRSLAESDVPMKILETIKLSEEDERWNRSIVNAALAALANMVNDFAPLREVCPRARLCRTRNWKILIMANLLAPCKGWRPETTG